MFSDRSAINGPSQPADAGGTSIQRNLFGDIVGGTRIEYIPSAAGGLGDFRRIYKDASGQDAYLDLKPSERIGEYSDSNRDAWRARQDRRTATAEAQRNTERQQGILDQRHRDELGLRTSQLQASIDANKASSDATLAQIGVQSKIAENSNIIAQGNLDLNRTTAKDAADARTQELSLTRQQMELNNNLQQQKLLQDDRQFERQAALDEKNSRRTRVLGALTLIAQSAAKF